MELVSDFTVCKAGDSLTPNQAALLRAFEIKQAAFHITPICRWTAEGVAMLRLPASADLCDTVALDVELHAHMVSCCALGNSYEELPGLKEQGVADDADADIHIEEEVT